MTEVDLTRRRYMQGLGATAAAGVGLTYTDGPVQDAEAHPFIVAGLAYGGAVALDWALREYYAEEASPPPDGVSAGALRLEAFKSSRMRESDNKGTFIDNMNILDGAEHTGYIEGKKAAIDAMNEGKTESETVSDAQDAVEQYRVTVVSNLIRSWNQTVQDLGYYWDALNDHPDADGRNVYNCPRSQYFDDGSASDAGMHDTELSSYTLADGSEIDLWRVVNVNSYGSTGWYTLFDASNTADYDTYTVYPRVDVSHDGGEFTFLDYDEWNPVYQEIDSTFQDVNDGISLWVNNVYGQVQSGEIDLSDLMTPRDRAAMLADEESMAQAIADLAALNIPIDVEREATVHLHGTDTTVRGTLAVTDESDGPFESGETYDPETFNGTAFLTFDVSLLEGSWSSFEPGVDGGVITFTEEPYDGLVYHVHTAAGETAVVPSNNWVDEEDGTWTYDASGDLETNITEVDSVDYYAESEETRFETIDLNEEFTIDKFENTETGEEEDSASFSSSEPQTDDNYITQEEWEQMQEENAKLIEEWEAALAAAEGGGGGGGGGFLGDVDTNTKILGAIAVVLAVFGLGASQ